MNTPIETIAILWNYRLCKRSDISSRLNDYYLLFDINKPVKMVDLSYIENYENNKNDYLNKEFFIKEINNKNGVITLTNNVKNHIVCFDSNIL